jgi:cysteine-rich repeat protein
MPPIFLNVTGEKSDIILVDSAAATAGIPIYLYFDVADPEGENVNLHLSRGPATSFLTTWQAENRTVQIKFSWTPTLDDLHNSLSPFLIIIAASDENNQSSTKEITVLLLRACRPGYFETNPGSLMVSNPSKCEACPGGSFGSKIDGAESCTSCPPGTYSDVLAATDESTCTQCPTNTTSQAGTVSYLDCVVIPQQLHVDNNHSGLAGTEVCGDGVETVGEECDDNNTINGDGCSEKCACESYPCFRCPVDSYLETIQFNYASKCTCNPGFFLHNNKCHDCTSSGSWCLRGQRFNCTECSTGQYKKSNCSGTSDTECSLCSNCQVEKHKCTTDHDAECESLSPESTSMSRETSKSVKTNLKYQDILNAAGDKNLSLVIALSPWVETYLSPDQVHELVSAALVRFGGFRAHSPEFIPFLSVPGLIMETVPGASYPNGLKFSFSSKNFSLVHSRTVSAGIRLSNITLLEYSSKESVSVQVNLRFFPLNNPYFGSNRTRRSDKCMSGMHWRIEQLEPSQTLCHAGCPINSDCVGETACRVSLVNNTLSSWIVLQVSNFACDVGPSCSLCFDLGLGLGLPVGLAFLILLLCACYPGIYSKITVCLKSALKRSDRLGPRQSLNQLSQRNQPVGHAIVYPVHARGSFYA